MNKSKNSKSCYIINHALLKSGDVILERGTGVHSEVIANKTKSHYSHAMIYVGGTIIEATMQGGVYSRVPNRISVENYDDLIVLRPKRHLDNEILSSVEYYARNLSGSVYSIREAILAGFNNKPDYMLTRGQFCSRLVAQSYQSVGIKIVQNPDFCSPGDIERSLFFFVVPNMIVRGSDQELEHASKSGTHDEHHKSAVKWVRASKKILFNHGIHTVKHPDADTVVSIETISDIMRAIYSNQGNKELDEAVATAMKNSGYMNGILDDQRANPYRYDYSEFSRIYNLMPNAMRVSNLKLEFKKEMDCINQRTENFKAALSNRLDLVDSLVFKYDFQIIHGMVYKMCERLDIIFDYCDSNDINFNFFDGLKYKKSVLHYKLENTKHLAV